MIANKIAIVTGASGNMGLAVVKKLLAEGYTVVGTVMKNELLQVTLQEQAFEKVVVDLTDENDAQQFVLSVLQKHGRIDVAVMTVGGFAMGDIATTATKDITQQYRLNFETAYNIARPCFAQMLQQTSGRIFFVGSRPGLRADESKGMIAYGLAKSLLVRLAELMNDEAWGVNVVCSVIVPSTIDTPQNRANMPSSDPSTWVKSESIADIIYFYCTSQAAAIRQPLIKMYNNA